MIHPAGWFDYQVPVRRRADGAWVGQALPGDPSRSHPGLVGERPALVLSSGFVTLTCTESVWQRLRRPAYRKSKGPMRQVVWEVGPAFEHVPADAAVLRVVRDGTGDLSAMLLLDAQAILAVGCVDHWLRDVIALEYDPRVEDDDLYWVKYVLAQPDTQSVWIDADDCDLEATRQFLRSLPDGSLHIACRAQDPAVASRLNQELMMDHTLMRRPSTSWTNVDLRFQTEADWVAYVRSLPDARPNDLHVQFHVAGATATLREREYANPAPWQIYLHRIKRRGLPGQHTVIGVAHDRSSIDQTMLIESTDRMATRALEMHRPDGDRIKST